MEKIEHIRTLKTDTKSILLIFRVKYDCCLSDYKLVFENDNNIILPQVKVTKGDFIWVTDMDSEEVRQVVSGNSSNTKTLILGLSKTNFDLENFKKMEKTKC